MQGCPLACDELGACELAFGKEQAGVRWECVCTRDCASTGAGVSGDKPQMLISRCFGKEVDEVDVTLSERLSLSEAGDMRSDGAMISEQN